MEKNKLLKRHRELKKVVTSFQLYRELEHIVVTGYFQENLFPGDMFLSPNLWQSEGTRQLKVTMPKLHSSLADVNLDIKFEFRLSLYVENL